jgi:hypothetical protein
MPFKVYVVVLFFGDDLGFNADFELAAFLVFDGRGYEYLPFSVLLAPYNLPPRMTDSNMPMT